MICLFKNAKQAEEYASKTIKAIEDLQIPHSGNLASKFVTASAGVAFKHVQTNVTTSEIYKIADDCLYKAKEKGRNQVVVSKEPYHEWKWVGSVEAKDFSYSCKRGLAAFLTP